MLTYVQTYVLLEFNGREGQTGSQSRDANYEMSTWAEDFSSRYIRPATSLALFILRCVQRMVPGGGQTAWVTSGSHGGSATVVSLFHFEVLVERADSVMD